MAHMHQELVDAINQQDEEAAILAVQNSMHRIKDIIE
jgi:DNA-binding FadR family transcriptional regulator